MTSDETLSDLARVFGKCLVAEKGADRLDSRSRIRRIARIIDRLARHPDSSKRWLERAQRIRRELTVHRKRVDDAQWAVAR